MLLASDAKMSLFFSWIIPASSFLSQLYQRFNLAVGSAVSIRSLDKRLPREFCDKIFLFLRTGSKAWLSPELKMVKAIRFFVTETSPFQQIIFRRSAGLVPILCEAPISNAQGHGLGTFRRRVLSEWICHTRSGHQLIFLL